MYDTGSEWQNNGSSKWSRIFGDGENPLRWSLPLYKLWGIAVRIHVVFVAIIVVKLLSTIIEDEIGFPFVATWMVGLFGLVLLHEYGHCFACRKAGGEADEILMWPLGGLASCLPPNTWKAHMVTVLGGPGVNVVLLPILAGGVYLVSHGRWSLVFFNPLDLASASGDAMTLGLVSWMLWSLHLTNVMLLAFNMLVPMFPMDGARVVHALIWRKKGRAVADRITSRVGIVAAIVLGTLAIVFNEMMLFAIAIFGGFVCFQEQRRQRFLEAPEDDWSMSEDTPSQGESEQSSKVDAQEIDRILAKISETGMQSLTRKEKKKLGKASSASKDS